MGTRFAASEESLASEAYKALLVSETMADVVLTDRISGLPATFLRGSIVQAGLDPDALPDRLELFKPNLRSEEHTSELQSLMRISYAVFCLKKKKQPETYIDIY